jgi:hypothetical protein
MRSVPADYILNHLAIALGQHLPFHAVERVFRNVAYDIETGAVLQDELISWATRTTTDLRLTLEHQPTWMPIATAPKDGTLILAMWANTPRLKPLLVYWEKDQEWWYEHPMWTRAAWEPGPSHWAQLPVWGPALAGAHR